MTDTKSTLRCTNCGTDYGLDRMNYTCDRCYGLLEVIHHDIKDTWIDGNREGVWRYKPLIYPGIEDKFIVTMGEGNTYHHRSQKVSQWVGMDEIFMKQEGNNPTGSFKDRGMTVAVSEARRLGAEATICASTGNTSASSAAYSAMGGLTSYVLIPQGNVSRSKLAQAVAYNSKIVNVPGDFDRAMDTLRQAVKTDPRLYMMNSINPWRLEGQKSITFEIMEKLGHVDFISVPAGNLGNTAAMGKALSELKSIGALDEIPRIISVQAEGANPFYRFWKGMTKSVVPVKADTIATAIKIGNPVNWKKAIKAINFSNGIVTSVTDEEIMSAKAVIDASGIGCEPASAASVAGVRKLLQEGSLDRKDRVVSVLTGNILKDIDAIKGTAGELTFQDLMDMAEIPASKSVIP